MKEANFRIHHLLKHVYQGTPFAKITAEWHEHVMRRRSAWWQRREGEDGSFLFRLQTGVKMGLYFDSRLSREIYCDEFELKERQFINAFLKEGDIFVDVGANIGLFTLIASYRVGKRGRIYSFEPCSKTYRRLVNNVELNHMNNVCCYQSALSDHTGQIEMNVSLDGYDAWNSIAQPIAGRSFAIETVCELKWDDFARDHNLIGRVKLIKVDVEGWESRVLSGGYESFSRQDAPVLQVEFTDQASQSAGTSCQSIYHQLEEFGYQMFIYEEELRRIIPDPMRDSYPYVNLLATKNPDEINSRLKKH